MNDNPLSKDELLRVFSSLRIELESQGLMIYSESDELYAAINKAEIILIKRLPLV